MKPYKSLHERKNNPLDKAGVELDTTISLLVEARDYLKKHGPQWSVDKVFEAKVSSDYFGDKLEIASEHVNRFRNLLLRINSVVDLSKELKIIRNRLVGSDIDVHPASFDTGSNVLSLVIEMMNMEKDELQSIMLGTFTAQFGAACSVFNKLVKRVEKYCIAIPAEKLYISADYFKELK